MKGNFFSRTMTRIFNSETTRVSEWDKDLVIGALSAYLLKKKQFTYRGNTYPISHLQLTPELIRSTMTRVGLPEPELQKQPLFLLGDLLVPIFQSESREHLLTTLQGLLDNSKEYKLLRDIVTAALKDYRQLLLAIVVANLRTEEKLYNGDGLGSRGYQHYLRTGIYDEWGGDNWPIYLAWRWYEMSSSRGRFLGGGEPKYFAALSKAAVALLMQEFLVNVSNVELRQRLFELYQNGLPEFIEYLLELMIEYTPKSDTLLSAAALGSTFAGRAQSIDDARYLLRPSSEVGKEHVRRMFDASVDIILFDAARRDERCFQLLNGAGKLSALLQRVIPALFINDKGSSLGSYLDYLVAPLPVCQSPFEASDRARMGQQQQRLAAPNAPHRTELRKQLLQQACVSLAELVEKYHLGKIVLPKYKKQLARYTEHVFLSDIAKVLVAFADLRAECGGQIGASAAQQKQAQQTIEKLTALEKLLAEPELTMATKYALLLSLVDNNKQYQEEASSIREALNVKDGDVEKHLWPKLRDAVGVDINHDCSQLAATVLDLLGRCIGGEKIPAVDIEEAVAGQLSLMARHTHDLR